MLDGSPHLVVVDMHLHVHLRMHERLLLLGSERVRRMIPSSRLLSLRLRLYLRLSLGLCLCLRGSSDGRDGAGLVVEPRVD